MAILLYGLLDTRAGFLLGLLQHFEYRLAGIVGLFLETVRLRVIQQEGVLVAFSLELLQDAVLGGLVAYHGWFYALVFLDLFLGGIFQVVLFFVLLLWLFFGVLLLVAR